MSVPQKVTVTCFVEGGTSKETIKQFFSEDDRVMWNPSTQTFEVYPFGVPQQ